MSLDLPDDHVRSPWENGMVEGVVQADPNQYQYIAYRHPHGFTWFAGPRRKPGTTPRYGGFVHWIRSTIMHKEIPPKDDREVAAVTYAGYIHLHQLENEWWIDYDNHIAPLKAAWAAQFHPGVPLLWLPPIPHDMHIRGVKYAHRRVAEREGRDHLLPHDFDQNENVEADYHLWD